MSTLRSASRWLPLVALALATLWVPSQAEFTPKRPAPLPAEEASGRVIVKFKSDATLLRRRIQSAGGTTASSTEVAQVMQARADGLGLRLGMSLRAGQALEERTQVVVADGVSSRTLAARVAADSEVEYAVVDGRRQAQRVPSDPLFTQGPTISGSSGGPAVGQWYLKPPQASVLTNGDEVLSSIDAQGAWDVTVGSSSIVVAVLDTGVRPEHPDLAGKLLPGYDMVSDITVANDGDGRDADPSDPGDWITSGDKATSTFSDCDVSDSSWHGTMTAGLIGAATDNAVGMAGTAWAVRVVPVRVLGKCFGYDSDIIAGIRWAAGLSVPGVPANANPARVLNLSLGGEGSCSQAYVDAVTAINAAGAVMVAAAGNGTGHAVGVPANCSGVIGVAGLRQIGTKVGYSDVGPQLTIAAPGGNCVNTDVGSPCLYPILSTTNAGTTVPGSSGYSDAFNISVGTSFSSPLVAGSAALMLSARPAMTPDEVRRMLRYTARTFPSSGAPADDTGVIQACHAPNTTDQGQCYCTTSTCGAGMLDTAAAVLSSSTLPLPRISVSSTSPHSGDVLTFDGSTSVVATGRSIATYQWSVVDAGGVISGFTGAADQASAAASTHSAGTFTVRLTVTDSAGQSWFADQQVSVAGSSSSGGGAVSLLWLLALASAVWALRLSRSPYRP